jgi:hypothetical protein
MAAAEEKLQASVTAAQQEIAGQLTSASVWEMRLMGFLGLLAVTDGALLTVAGGLGDSRWILLIGASGAIAVILVGLLVVRGLKSGPNAVNFYAKYREAPLADFMVHMLADLGKAIFVNRRSIERREALFLTAVSWAAIFAIWFGLVRVIG